MKNATRTTTRRLIATAAVLMLAFFFVARDAQAQSDPPKVEIGGHFSLLRLPRDGQVFDTTAAGGGARATFNLNANVALEGEVNYYRKLNSNPILTDSPAITGLFGVKAGWRGESVGVFAKVRPGVLHFKETLDPRIVFIVPPPVPQNPQFALDLGGVLEAYPSRRLVIRFDVGDTVIRFRYRISPLGEIRFTTHNVQFNAGIGFRFF